MYKSCSELTSMTIGSGVTTIGDRAFESCSSLEGIICRTMTPPVCNRSFGNDCFYSVDKSACTLFVPMGTAESYRAADVWKEFLNIQEVDFNTGIGSIEADAAEAGAVEIYSLDGVRHPEGIKKLRPGNYVVRQGGRSRKIHVRQAR